MRSMRPSAAEQAGDAAVLDDLTMRLVPALGGGERDGRRTGR